MRALASVVVCVTALYSSTSAYAAPVPRQGPVSGRIVAKKQGETQVLVPSPQQLPAQVNQDLKAGDVLRTNATGTLAIVFADRTQLRIGRNSTLVIKQVSRGSPSSVSLQKGSVWARSPRGASQLSVETPSATAAIRGTEYSITANDEQTTISVVEGIVDFFNPQGQLELRGGESAAARLGQAPTKIVTVRADLREQQLFYLSLADGLAFLQPSAVPLPAARAALDRALELAPAERSAQDWLSIAENGAGKISRKTIEQALANARAARLTEEQEARARLVEAGYAASDKDYARALGLYEAALPQLGGRQREVARYGVFIMRSVVGPSGSEPAIPELDPAQPVSYAGQSFIAAYLGDFDKARAIADEGLRRHPEETQLYAIKAGIGVLSGDEAAIDEATRQALAIDPQDADALRFRAELALAYRGDPEAAVADAREALRLAPAEDTYAGVLAQALSAREEDREAERVLRSALEERPNSYVLRTNYALLLMQQHRIAEARAQIAIAQQLEPGSAPSLLAEALLHLQQGDREQALDSALDASAANPAYSEALLTLAEIYFANGDYELARQQIEAADRADPNSPYVALYRAALAIDTYDADEAISAAREVLRRYRARGGVYAKLSESKGSGSYIAGAFRLLNLEEWAKYAGDRTFDPFVSTALFDRALSPVNTPYLVDRTYLPFDPTRGAGPSAVSDIFQGIRFDPLAVSGSERDLHLTRQEFIELSLTPSLLVTEDDAKSSQSAALNGLVLDPVRFAYSVSASRTRLDVPLGSNNDRDGESVQGFFGFQPTPYDNVVLFTGHTRERSDLTGTLFQPRTNGAIEQKSTSIHAVYAHEFGRENYLSIGGGLLSADQNLSRNDQAPFLGSPFLFEVDYREKTKTDAHYFLADYAVGLGPVDVQVGGEYMAVKSTLATNLALPDLGVTNAVVQRSQGRRYRGYADLRYTPSNVLTLQAQAAVSGARAGGTGKDEFDFSVGAAFEPVEGQWLRAAYVRATPLGMPITLAPTAVVGLKPAEPGNSGGMQNESVIGRWDAEWSEHLFTSVEFQHQEFDALGFERPESVIPIFDIALDPPLGEVPVVVGRSRLDRVTASANLWLTGNVGLRASYAYSHSRVKSGPGAGGPIPFVSPHFARGQATWTSTERIRVTAGVSYLGARNIDAFGTRAPEAWLGDVALQWQPFEKQIEIELGLYNAFDERVLIGPGVPSFGRTAAASVSFRF